MATLKHRANHSRQARLRILVISFVLILFVTPILILASAHQAHSAEAAETNDSSIWLDGPSQALRGETISYEIKTDAAGIYGVQMELRFDPAVLQAVNTQLTPGNCPTPDHIQINTVDNSAGILSYTVTSLNPTPPCDGGIVASIQFKVSPAAIGGSTVVQFDEVILADKDGTEIPATSVDLSLEILVTTADFSGTPTTGFAPLTVDFTNLSSGDYDTCTWDFGDNSGSSSCENQSHNYTIPGTYTVELTISGPSGSDSETKIDYIYASEHYWLSLPIILK